MIGEQHRDAVPRRASPPRPPPLAPQVPLHVGFVGTGLIGKVTVKQMAAQAPALLATTGLDIRLAGATDSKSMILANSDAGMTHAAFPAAIAERVEDWDATAVDAAVSPVDLDGFVDALGGASVRRRRLRRRRPTTPLRRRWADKYAVDWLGAGVHVIPEQEGQQR